MRTLYDEIKEKANEKRKQGRILEAESIEEELRENKSVAEDVIIEHDGVEQISLIDPKSIKFVSFSECGACGDPGKIYIVTKKSNDVHKYCFDYMNETPIEAFDALLPWLTPFIASISYILNSNKHPSGFKHIYMGMGNSLFVAEDIYDEFVNEEMGLLIKTHQKSKIYQQWKDIMWILKKTKKTKCIHTTYTTATSTRSLNLLSEWQFNEKISFNRNKSKQDGQL